MESSKSTIQEVIRGQCRTDDLPRNRSRSVMVYLSSTPDMTAERDAIQRFVYPRLKQYCAGQYGIDFKFVELHWGTEESTGYFSSDLEILKREVVACQQRSLGPNFLCLVGHKLGPAYLPHEIPNEQYDLLQKKISETRGPKESTLEDYYEVDESNQCYRLRSEKRHYIVSESAISLDGRHDDLVSFKRRLRACILEAYSDGHLNEVEKRALTTTAFETEVQAGLQNTEINLKDTALCLFRTIRNLSQYQENMQYGRFRDIRDGISDEESQNRLLNIRELEIRKLVPQSNIKQITTDWDSVSVTANKQSDEIRLAKFAQKFRQGNKLKLLQHEDFLEDLCNKVYSPLKQLIDRALAPSAVEVKTAVDTLYDQIVEHWQRVKLAEGGPCSEEILSRLIKYLRDGMAFPFIVHGGSAENRSTLLAKCSAVSAAAAAAANLATEKQKECDQNTDPCRRDLVNIPDRMEPKRPQYMFMNRKREQSNTPNDNYSDCLPYVVVRCLGLISVGQVTPVQLLRSLCAQISFLYDKPWSDTASFEQLVQDFDQFINECPSRAHPLHILLDGFELLITNPRESGLRWIPDNLPEHVRLVVTCSSDAEQLLNDLINKTPYESLIRNLDEKEEHEETDDVNTELVALVDKHGEHGVDEHTVEANLIQQDSEDVTVAEDQFQIVDKEMESIINDRRIHYGRESDCLVDLSPSDEVGRAKTGDFTTAKNLQQEGAMQGNDLKSKTDEGLQHKTHTNGKSMTMGADGPMDSEQEKRLASIIESTSHIRRELNDQLFRLIQKERPCNIDGDLPLERDIADTWLDCLERAHGKQVVRCVFRLLSLAKSGLSECELLDLLSLDEELLCEGVFLGIQPALRRFPELLWARLKKDLGSVVQFRCLDNRDVVNWAIPGIACLTLARYNSALYPASKTHHQMALYFMGIAARPRPMDDCQSVASSQGAYSGIEPEVRVDAQPSVFEPADRTYGKVHYNQRRLTELPHHLLHAGQLPEVQRHVLFCYKWLYKKLCATSAAELLATVMDLTSGDQFAGDEDVGRLVKVLEESLPFINEAPSCLRAELTGRLLSHMAGSTLVASLICQCDDEGYRQCPVTPLTSSFDEGEDETLQIIPCDTGYYEELCMTPVPGINRVATYTVPEKLVLWNADSADQLLRYECSQYTYCTDMRVTQNGRYLLTLNNGQPRQAFLEDSPVLDIYDVETGKKARRIYFQESDRKPKRLFRVMGLNERRFMFDTPNYIAVCIDIVRLCDIRSGKELSKMSWPFLVTPDERFLVMTEHDGHRLVLRSFPDLLHIARLSSPKNITAIAALVTEITTSVLVAAGSSGVLSLYSLDDLEHDPSSPIEPLRQGVLVEKKDSAMKGGCGSLLLSKDNNFALASYIYASGKEIHRTNFIVATETLENVHIYESAVKDKAQFSHSGEYLLHLKVASGILDVIGVQSGDVVATYQTDSEIRQICCSLNDDNVVFVATKVEVQVIDLLKLVARGSKEREQVQVDADSDTLSVEYNEPKSRLRALSVHVPLSALISSKTVENFPVFLTQVDEDSGEVKAETITLHRGLHYGDTELPSYLTGVIVTPNGKRFLLIFEQLHIVSNSTGKGEKKVVSGPLSEDAIHTKVTTGLVGIGANISRDIFGVGKNVLSHGTSLQRGSKIYDKNDTRRGTLFEAEGGETIQRCPSVIRIYDAMNGDCVQALPIRNEKVLSCSNTCVVTAAGDGEFTNVYNITTGQLVSTLDCGPASATFTVDDSCLVVVPRRHQAMLHIYTGSSYLDLRRCELGDDELLVWEVTTCVGAASSVLISLVGERADHLGRDSSGVDYSWVDVVYASVTASFTCHSELVQLSPDGTIGVDSEFRFYDTKAGRVLFQIRTEDVNLVEHASCMTDDGNLMLFLDNEKGTINVVDVQKRRLVSKSYFHPRRSKADSLRGHRDLATLIPLHGGMQLVIVDGSSVKQFLLQTARRQVVAMGMVKLRNKAFGSPGARTEYYHTVNSDGDVPLTRRTTRRTLHQGRGSRAMYVFGRRK